MTQPTRELMRKALALPEGGRMALIRVLIESLDDATDADVERAWDEEISCRIADLDSERARTVSWREVQQRITARLEHGK